MALNISAANLGIALGALAGGFVVTTRGIGAIGWGPLAVLPLIVVLVAALAPRKVTGHVL
ncbi:hypothetical protein PQR68_08095 [Paraburkholderia agricolaris]|uniref:hypothetical protein n=1 Tax=Paraburkholderia agricolaris TaxID=2152888 RepID=UPI0038BE0A92